MPSRETWWWVGIGTGVAALVTTGSVLVARRLRAPVTTAPVEPEPLGPAPEKPEVPQAPGVFFPELQLRQEMCLQWQSALDRPDWRPALIDLIHSDVDTKIESMNPTWTTIPQLDTATYLVTRAALAQGCPKVPLPTGQKNAKQLAETGPRYWRELWDMYYSYAYQTLSELGS